LLNVALRRGAEPDGDHGTGRRSRIRCFTIGQGSDSSSRAKRSRRICSTSGEIGTFASASSAPGRVGWAGAGLGVIGSDYASGRGVPAPVGQVLSRAALHFRVEQTPKSAMNTSNRGCRYAADQIRNTFIEQFVALRNVHDGMTALLQLRTDLVNVRLERTAQIDLPFLRARLPNGKPTPRPPVRVFNEYHRRRQLAKTGSGRLCTISAQ
jgi:hypothetical protein